MQIDGAILRDYLDSFCQVSFCKVGNVKFEWADLVMPKEKLSPDTLYVCSNDDFKPIADRLEHDSQQNEPISFLVVTGFDLASDDEMDHVSEDDTSQNAFAKSKKARVVIECKSSLTPFDLSKRLQEYMRKLTEWKLTMDNEMLCGGMHQDMLDLSEPIFGNTVLVVDCDYNLVAYTRGSAGKAGVLNSVIEKGRFDENALAQLVEAQLISAGHLPMSGKTQRQSWAKLDTFEVIARPYFSKNSFNAFLIMACDNRKPSRGLECLFGILAEAIGHCVAKDVQQRLRPGSREERFVISLLEDKQPTGDQLEQSCREHGMPLVGKLRVCQFLVGESCSIGFAEKEIRNNIGRCWLSIRGNTITAICCDELIIDDSQLLSDHLLASILEDNDISLALSNVYYDVADTNIAYRQAHIASRFVGRVDATGLRQDSVDARIVPFWMIAPLWAVSQDESADRFLLDHLSKDNSITRLTRGDKPSSVSDVIVLYHFLRNNCDARITAELLYMHRNTVYYRVRRIEEALDVDMSKPEVRSYLWFLFVLMQAKGTKIA